ncbi:MotA/TolQ/ExbB proton channel family protein [Paraburkholderia silvatlantica]|uniref:Biopolymer transport protein ExbB n=1 Tax=Paraburkholderia silvatlantica TaxID=321895 RepID=A0A2U1A782_9BURK|nr:MotA/TolQ/ExbB proton channel family protein [Paraburkholderia silvatlantica]MBB2931467.1 biopolymer transport protein ExbB [Paraburkholderia silvatlantica]PVY27869.1 outer membrane transport energization protein ExbB [Paraburkholderia silvatlantica]PXW34716.1 outer membrane transport energization protein ExbB [Paraburkholderia silvatlantica]PYE20556.1 outer membrane transport energization protein ExbB [Paraburkholderia silvatlantica]TDQ98582.1 outer membrane transport energization protein 
MNDWSGVAEAFMLGGWVIYPLSLLAIAALTITFDRAYVWWRYARTPRDGDASALPGRHVLRRLDAQMGDGNLPIWRIEAQIEAAASQIERDMSRGLWLLETIVTAAPLLGLLGTIVGMMHSFRLIGGDGLVNPSGVSGGVAQALVATAIGLVIALVTLFAFNYFSRRVERLMDELEMFANKRLGDLRLARENGGAAS